MFFVQQECLLDCLAASPLSWLLQVLQPSAGCGRWAERSASPDIDWSGMTSHEVKILANFDFVNVCTLFMFFSTATARPSALHLATRPATPSHTSVSMPTPPCCGGPSRLSRTYRFGCRSCSKAIVSTLGAHGDSCCCSSLRSRSSWTAFAPPVSDLTKSGALPRTTKTCVFRNILFSVKKPRPAWIYASASRGARPP